jgi:hypothetical protein
VETDPYERLRVACRPSGRERSHRRGRARPSVRVHVEFRVKGPVACRSCGQTAWVKERPVVALADLPRFGRQAGLVRHKHPPGLGGRHRVRHPRPLRPRRKTFEDSLDHATLVAEPFHLEPCSTPAGPTGTYPRTSLPAENPMSRYHSVTTPTSAATSVSTGQASEVVMQSAVNAGFPAAVNPSAGVRRRCWAVGRGWPPTPSSSGVVAPSRCQGDQPGAVRRAPRWGRAPPGKSFTDFKVSRLKV